MHQNPSDEKTTKQTLQIKNPIINPIKSRQVDISRTFQANPHPNPPASPTQTGGMSTQRRKAEGGPHPRSSDFRFPADPSSTIGISDALRTHGGSARLSGTFPNNHGLHPQGRRFSDNVRVIYSRRPVSPFGVQGVGLGARHKPTVLVMGSSSSDIVTFL